MEKIKWCMRKANGLEIIDPNDNLSQAYLNKAEDSLKASAALKDNKDWEISSLYYTMYFSLYAILMKIGIKCEIHACTIAFMKYHLSEYFTRQDVELINKSMQARIDTQYYTDRNVSSEQYSDMISNAPAFLIQCKEILLDLTDKDIKKIRDSLPSSDN